MSPAEREQEPTTRPSEGAVLAGLASLLLAVAERRRQAAGREDDVNDEGECRRAA